MSGRWGEEEKKSRGLVSFFIVGGIFVLACYLFYTNYQNLENRRQLEKGMQDIVRSGLKKSKKELVDEILLHANNELNIPLTQDQVDLVIGTDEYRNKTVDVWIDFYFTVDLLVYSWETQLPISEKLTLIYF